MMAVPRGFAVRRATLDSQYVTGCSICRLGVFESQPWQWSRRPLGICHTECVEALPVCQWCERPFHDPAHPQSPICPSCATKELFGSKGVPR